MNQKLFVVQVSAAGSGSATELLPWEPGVTLSAAAQTVVVPAGKVRSVMVEIPAGAAAEINELPRVGPEVFEIDGDDMSTLAQATQITATAGVVTVLVGARKEEFNGILT